MKNLLVYSRDFFRIRYKARKQAVPENWKIFQKSYLALLPTFFIERLQNIIDNDSSNQIFEDEISHVQPQEHKHEKTKPLKTKYFVIKKVISNFYKRSKPMNPTP